MNTILAMMGECSLEEMELIATNLKIKIKEKREELKKRKVVRNQYGLELFKTLKIGDRVMFRYGTNNSIKTGMVIGLSENTFTVDTLNVNGKNIWRYAVSLLDRLKRSLQST